MATESFDIADVRKRAETAIQKGPDEVRNLYMAEIMDWTDNYSENFIDDPQSTDSLFALEQIVKLWVEYATFESQLRQFKKAVQVFDNALNDAVVNKCKSIYTSYINYCKERSKIANAQKVFRRGLCAELSVKEIDCLWEEFLVFMRSASTATANLTMTQLVDATSQQVLVDVDVGGTLHLPSDGFLNNLVKEKNKEPETVSAPPSSGAAATDAMDVAPTETPATATSAEPMDVIESKVSIDLEPIATDIPASTVEEVVESKETEAALSMETLVKRSYDDIILDGLDDVSGISPEQLFKRYYKSPPLLFVTSLQEPMVSGIANLTPEQIQILDMFFGISLKTISHNPTDLKSEDCNKLNKYLDLFEGLWNIQALKERHFDYWFTELRRIHATEDEAFRKELDAKAVDATKRQTIAKARQNRIAVQGDVIRATVNKTLLSLLIEHEQILVEADVPFFTQDTVDKLKSAQIVHGGDKYDDALCNVISKHRSIICSLLSLRLVTRSQNTHSGEVKPFMPLNELLRPQAYDYTQQVELTRQRSSGSMGGSAKKKRRRPGEMESSPRSPSDAIQDARKRIGLQEYDPFAALGNQPVREIAPALELAPALSFPPIKRQEATVQLPMAAPTMPTTNTYMPSRTLSNAPAASNSSYLAGSSHVATSNISAHAPVVESSSAPPTKVSISVLQKLAKAMKKKKGD